MANTAIEDLRCMVRFFNGVEENINYRIRTVSEAFGIWCAYNEVYNNNGEPELVVNDKGRVRVIDLSEEEL